MATALDLLMSTKEDVNLLSEESDICTIDAKTRVIFVPSTIVVGGVQSDKNAERIKFSCPKIVGDNLDLSKFSVRINFENVSSVDFNVSIKDQYICDDVAVDGENVTFSWLIGRNAARYMGTVRFIVCAVKTDSDSNISVEWNTAIAEVPVLEGIEIAQPQIGQEEKDVINQLLELTKNTSAEAVQNVNSAKEQAIKDIQSVSQPDTTLTIEGGLAEAKATGEAIGLLKEDISNKITKFYASNQGETHITDSDNGKIKDMMLYGKSSQDGTPTLENPVEIKSVVNPTVKAIGKNLAGLWKQGLLSTDDGEKIIANNYWVNTKEYVKISVNNYAFSSDSTCKAIIYEYDRDKKYIRYMQLLVNDKSAIYVPSSKCAYIKFGYNYDASKESIAPDEMGAKHWLQLELGSTPTVYEPYHEQTVTFPYTLNAIPVNSGGNVTIDGQQYIADYIDVENGKIVKYVKKLFLKPFQWIKAINKGVLRFYASTIDAVGIAGNKIIINSSSISSHFAFVTSTPDRIGTFTLNADGTNANIGFAFSTDTTITSDDFNNWILNNKPFVFLPVLKEELPLTSEQILALKKLSTYYPVTNIFINSEQLDGYTVFNYPISMENGWNYVKQQIGDTRDYIYDMDLQSAEAYVNSEYAVALTELEV